MTKWCICVFMTSMKGYLRYWRWNEYILPCTPTQRLITTGCCFALILIQTRTLLRITLLHICSLYEFRVFYKCWMPQEYNNVNKKFLAIAKRKTEVRKQKSHHIIYFKQSDVKAITVVMRIKIKHLIYDLWTISSWSSTLVTTWGQMTLKDEKAHFKIPANQ